MSDVDYSKLCVGGFWLMFVHKAALDAETNRPFLEWEGTAQQPTGGVGEL